VSVLGKKKAARKIDTYTALQELLGEHQDSVISAEVLRRLGATAGTTAGENGFTFGVMHERELARAADARRKLSVVGRAKSDRRLSVSPGAS
jgi:CHAD domain-containing protein